MLITEENERLTRVGRGTPMGELIRRFWLPFLLSADVPKPDCAPYRVSLLGEQLVAFRDSDGRVGLVSRLCAHRNADLFFGRNEQGGLRCTYHGWKYDAGGNCLDMPTEDETSNFKDKIHLKAYPVVERAGVLWTYMGPEDLTPEMPDFPWMHVPDDHRFVSWNRQQNNFVQAVEGGIDSAHVNFLHSTVDAHRTKGAGQDRGRRSGRAMDTYIVRDTHPKFSVRETEYGLVIGARRDTGESSYYWRLNNFGMPFWTTPGGGDGTGGGLHAFVPLDDHTVARWSFTCQYDRPYSGRELSDMRAGSGIHSALIPGTHDPIRNMANDYLIDREEQQTLTFTGIRGTGEQDYSVQEGMGVITDRSTEHLGTSDTGIIAMRRMLQHAADQLEDGVEPAWAHIDGSAYLFHGAGLVLPSDVDWGTDERFLTATKAKV